MWSPECVAKQVIHRNPHRPCTGANGPVNTESVKRRARREGANHSIQEKAPSRRSKAGTANGNAGNRECGRRRRATAGAPALAKLPHTSACRNECRGETKKKTKNEIRYPNKKGHGRERRAGGEITGIAQRGANRVTQGAINKARKKSEINHIQVEERCVEIGQKGREESNADQG